MTPEPINVALAEDGTPVGVVDDCEQAPAPEETPEEAAAKDAFHRIPNRQMKRDAARGLGETRRSRSRIQRRIYRDRRKHAA